MISNITAILTLNALVIFGIVYLTIKLLINIESDSNSNSVTVTNILEPNIYDKIKLAIAVGLANVVIIIHYYSGKCTVASIISLATTIIYLIVSSYTDQKTEYVYSLPAYINFSINIICVVLNYKYIKQIISLNSQYLMMLSFLLILMILLVLLRKLGAGDVLIFINSFIAIMMIAGAIANADKTTNIAVYEQASAFYVFGVILSNFLFILKYLIAGTKYMIKKHILKTEASMLNRVSAYTMCISVSMIIVMFIICYVHIL